MRFARKKKLAQTAIAVFAAVSMIGGLFSGVLDTHQAVAAGMNPGKTDFSVSGERLVWLEQDATGVKQVHTLNQSNGASTRLTSSPSPKDAPYVNGAIVVWADKGNEAAGSLQWDIYSTNLETGKPAKLNKQPGSYGNPTTDGVGVVWYERKHYGSMIYHDLATGAEADLGEGRFPMLASGNVVYKNARDGGLSLLNVNSGVRRALVSLGGANTVDWFVFNGSQVLYKQKNGAAGSKYVLLNIQDLMAQPVDLTEMKDGGTSYAHMFIGEKYAVFQQEENGAAVLQQVNLNTSKVTPLPAIETGAKLIGISGDKLLYSTKDDNIQSLDLKERNFPAPTPTHVANPSPSLTPEPGPTPEPGSAPGMGTATTPGSNPNVKVPVVSGAKDSRIIGNTGGVLSVLNGWARLEIAAGTFPDNTGVSLAQAELETKELLDANGLKLLKAGSVWQVQSDAAFQLPVKLAIRYPKEEPWVSEREKLGIYSYDPAKGTWTYIAGVTEVERDFVHAPITASGLYAVMLRNVHFTDLAGHWARHNVEVLASRGIVNGMNGNLYKPKGSVTRAEFTKLLVSALGLRPSQEGAPSQPVTPSQEGTPSQPGTPSFRDIPAVHWSYPYVEAAAEAGIVTGDNGLFHGNDPLTREQMMVMLMRAIDSTTVTMNAAHGPDTLKITGTTATTATTGTTATTETADTTETIDTNDSIGTTGISASAADLAKARAGLTKFKDSDQISKWAKDSAAAAVEKKLVQGSGQFLKPKASSTRAEAAVLIYKLLAELKFL
ncbi:S-layer homology domain-containing protein [Paenibacillus sp. CN-4]|uniref:S-layer homology domain-containing protein n=1 Tax=Paenibacillus nanchangensis TaxID=3348343 RepID=UPI003978CA14